MKQAQNEGKQIVLEDVMKRNLTRALLPPIMSGFPVGAAARQEPGGARPPRGKLKHNASQQGHWSTFWREFGLENEPYERCFIPGDGRHTVDQHWAQLAENLPTGAQIIDLGCGSGVVGSTLLNRRTDLHITGVDWANVPTPNVANLTIHPWVCMESLPFGERCFDGAVSLFGIEYGNIVKTIQELERVLRRGAHFSFLVHHRDSEISREGSARRRALKELLYGKMKAAFLGGNAAGVDQLRQGLRSLFPGEPMVNLVGNYFRRNLMRTRAERQAIWQDLADALDPEIALLMHLERAAKSANEMATWLAPILSAMSLVRVSVLRRRSGEPIAWDVNGIR